MGRTTNDNRLPVIEILSTANDKINKPISSGVNETPTDLAENAIDALKVLAGKAAFRIYDAGAGTIGRNAMGTLQGVVKSANGRMVFNVITEVGEKIEIIAFLAGLADNIEKTTAEFQAVWMSKDPSAVKAATSRRTTSPANS